jgi:hypothetical protein
MSPIGEMGTVFMRGQSGPRSGTSRIAGQSLREVGTRGLRGGEIRPELVDPVGRLPRIAVLMIVQPP